MSTFGYGKHTDKHLGIWLRYESNPDLIKMIKSNRNLRIGDSVRRIVVSEYDKTTNEVLLEIWCFNILNYFLKKHRYNVFYIKTPINEDWVCEGDLGNGINF